MNKVNRYDIVEMIFLQADKLKNDRAEITFKYKRVGHSHARDSIFALMVWALSKDAESIIDPPFKVETLERHFPHDIAVISLTGLKTEYRHLLAYLNKEALQTFLMSSANPFAEGIQVQKVDIKALN